MRRSSRRVGVVIGLALVLGTTGGSFLPAAAGGGTGSLRLLSVKDEVTVHRFGDEPVWLDPRVHVAAVGDAFHLRVGRHRYGGPISVHQVVTEDGGTALRPLPAEILDGWAGLARFFRVTVRTDDGTVLQDRSVRFCPNTWNPQRIGDAGPHSPTFPSHCSANPFVLGMVWGIDRDWAVNPFEFGTILIDAPDGHYLVDVSIRGPFRKLFSVAPEHASVTVGVTVTTTSDGCPDCPPPEPAGRTSAEQAPTVRTETEPDPSMLPDLVALPAFGMNASSTRTRDFLNFGSTVWIGGHSPLDVQGFRRPGTDVMDAYQYFHRDGEIVGQAPAGTLEYDPPHGHWHFTQFATYKLVSVATGAVVRSRKQGFCLAPTDAVDLLVPGATLRPESTGFHSVCGSEDSLWVRETLPLGWGDTYFQGTPGQAFDITGLPNGEYRVLVITNEDGSLHEVTARNNVGSRKVVLGGETGARTVTVRPWHGIDTEGGCWDCR